MRISFAAGLLFFLVAAIKPAHAVEQQSSLRSAPSPPVGAPTRGTHQSGVLRRFGEPQQRLPAVGGDRPQHPPISRWVYPSFTVYFERELVITAVTNSSVDSTPPAS